MCANPWQPFGLRERRFRNRELVQPRTQVQQQLRVEAGANFAGEDEIIRVEVTQSNAPRPTRLPCGSVNPPTTSSCVASHFIFSQYDERRCSYGDVRSFAITPSQPSRHARSQGLSSLISGTCASGARSGTSFSKARRASSANGMTERPSSHRMSNTWYTILLVEFQTASPSRITSRTGSLTIASATAGWYWS